MSNVGISFGQLQLDDVGLRRLQKLHNVLFPRTDASLEWLRWYMQLGKKHHPPVLTRAHAAFDGDELVGLWCVEPKALLGDKPPFARVGRCFSVGIHPDYRRRNLFVELSEHAIEAERRIGDYDYVLGFPQVGRPVIAAHLKSGWETVQDIEMMSVAPTKHADRSLACIDHVNHGQHPVPDAHRGSFVERGAYLNDRWVMHPDNAYVRLVHGSSYLIAKPYGNGCHILDFQGTHAQLLLEAISTLAYHHAWSEVTTWCATNDPYRTVAEAAGFKPGAQMGSSVTLLAVRINARQPLQLGSSHFQMGSEEIY